MARRVRQVKGRILKGVGGRSFIVLMASLLTACSGGSSSTGSASADGSGSLPPAPTLSLSATPSSVSVGGSSTLSWDAEDADGCEASSGWSGARGTSGSEEVGPLNADTTFRLSCSGAGGGVSRQVTITVDQGNGPSVTLTAEPEQVPVGSPSTLTWSSDDATSCSASGGWSGSRDLSGSVSTGPLSQSTTYTLTCTGTSGDAVAMVHVEVLDKTLRWQAPTENVDGTPLDDLAGFNIYWGTESRNYQGSHRIEDANATEWEVTLAAGEYFFALTAFDADENESGFSNEVSKVIP